MTSFVDFAPAKINLFLAITERRPDNFHNLVSVAAPLDYGDTLWLNLDDRSGENEQTFRLSCDAASVPLDESNLILKATRLFIASTGWGGGGAFHLIKRIPMGAGLGGGSSDASAALRILNAAAGTPLAQADLINLATQIGSDCPLFLAGAPIIMRSRGEILEKMSEETTKRIAGRRVLVFKPWFGISTPWAYQQLATAAPALYLPPSNAEALLARWICDTGRPLDDLLFNNMEAPAFRKFISIPVLLQMLSEKFGLSARMSGSGSACFALMQDDFDARPVIAAIKAAWGSDAFVIETCFAHVLQPKPDRC